MMEGYQLGKDIAEIRQTLERMEASSKIQGAGLFTPPIHMPILGSAFVSLTEDLLNMRGRRLLSPHLLFQFELNALGQLQVVSGPRSSRPGEVVWKWGKIITTNVDATNFQITLSRGVSLAIGNGPYQRWLTFENGVPHRLDLWDDSSLHIYSFDGRLLFDFNYGEGLPDVGWTVGLDGRAVPSVP